MCPQAFGIARRIIATNDFADNENAARDLKAVAGWEATVTMASAMDVMMRRHIDRLHRRDDTQIIKAHIEEARRILAAFDSDRQRIVMQLRRFAEQPGTV